MYLVDLELGRPSALDREALVSDHSLKVAVSKFQSSHQGSPSGGRLERPPVSKRSRLNEVIDSSAYLMLRIEVTDSKPEHRMAPLTVNNDGGDFHWGLQSLFIRFLQKTELLTECFDQAAEESLQ